LNSASPSFVFLQKVAEFATVRLIGRPAPRPRVDAAKPRIAAESLFKAVNRTCISRASRCPLARSGIDDRQCALFDKEQDGSVIGDASDAKGKTVVFRDEAHIGVIVKEKIIHTVKSLRTNVADSLALPHLLHGKRLRVYEIRRTAVKGM